MSHFSFVPGCPFSCSSDAEALSLGLAKDECPLCIFCRDRAKLVPWPDAIPFGANNLGRGEDFGFGRLSGQRGKASSIFCEPPPLLRIAAGTEHFVVKLLKRSNAFKFPSKL